jgi:two-component system, sensor histidine kinase RegB
MAFDLEPAVTLPWLVRLRWLFVACQLVVWAAVWLGFGATLPWWPFVVAIGVVAISNLAITSTPARGWSPAHLMGGVLILDTMLLTLQLAGLGGATNPFSVFYLVYITLSAVVLSARWTTAVATLAIVGFAVLFVVPAETHVHHSGPPLLNPHLQGMWAAFVMAAGLTAFFVRRISRAIASQREQIATLRETAARNARLASLATLAAGAAHELNSPLSTIAIAAHEAIVRFGKTRGSADPAAADSTAADLDLILEQVDRCQRILHQMAARSTDGDVPEVLAIERVVADVRAGLGERAARLDVVTHGEASGLAVPPAQLAQSLVALVKNALDASPPDELVVLEIRRAGTNMSIVIEDRGSGISADVLAKVGEPFFTTKQPGRGMGLGVFLARVFFESRGGTLALESTVGVGTRASASLPIGGPA